MDPEIKKILDEHEKRLNALESSGTKRIEQTQPKKQSIKEFLLEKKPKSDVERSLAIGYFLENNENHASFNVADLEKSYRNAKEKIPSNINESVNKNVKKGHIMLAKEKKDGLKAWELTSTGEKYIENGLKEK